jgi:hypothetical protein
MMILALVLLLAAGATPCAEDARKLCLGVGPANDAVGRKASRNRLDEKRPSGIREPCRGDVERFCRGATRSGGLAACLKEHESELSAACKDQGSEIAGVAQQRRGSIRALPEACKGDAAKFCPAVEANGITRCLKGHRSGLSAKCASAFADIRQDR